MGSRLVDSYQVSLAFFFCIILFDQSSGIVLRVSLVTRFVWDGIIFKVVNIGYIELLGIRSGMVNYWDILYGT
jgi:hypothetical protein